MITSRDLGAARRFALVSLCSPNPMASTTIAS